MIDIFNLSGKVKAPIYNIWLLPGTSRGGYGEQPLRLAGSGVICLLIKFK